MKMTYSKPYLVVESFQLSAAAAASCSVSIEFGQDTCGYGELGEGYWAYFNYDNCDTNMVDDNGTDNGYCYHGPNSEANFIHS